MHSFQQLLYISMAPAEPKNPKSSPLEKVKEKYLIMNGGSAIVWSRLRANALRIYSGRMFYTTFC